MDAYEGVCNTKNVSKNWCRGCTGLARRKWATVSATNKCPNSSYTSGEGIGCCGIDAMRSAIGSSARISMHQPVLDASLRAQGSTNGRPMMTIANNSAATKSSTRSLALKMDTARCYDS